MYKKFRTCEERKAFMYEPIQNKNTSQLIVDQIKNMILINLKLYLYLGMVLLVLKTTLIVFLMQGLFLIHFIILKNT